jgi:hypothetical protein
MLKRAFLLIGCCYMAAWAGPVTYQVTVATSSIAGTSGSLDFQFNPGPLSSQPGTAQLMNFSSNGILDPSDIFTTGHVSGAHLPATLTFDNGTALNEYFEGFTYGSTLNFQVILSGLALMAPNGTGSGSVFAFSMFSDAAGTQPVLTTDTTFGIAVKIAVNPNGTSTVTDNSRQTAVGLVPEPTPLWLMAAPLALVLRSRRRLYT